MLDINPAAVRVAIKSLDVGFVNMVHDGIHEHTIERPRLRLERFQGRCQEAHILETETGHVLPECAGHARTRAFHFRLQCHNLGGPQRRNRTGVQPAPGPNIKHTLPGEVIKAEQVGDAHIKPVAVNAISRGNIG